MFIISPDFQFVIANAKILAIRLFLSLRHSASITHIAMQVDCAVSVLLQRAAADFAEVSVLVVFGGLAAGEPFLVLRLASFM